MLITESGIEQEKIRIFIHFLMKNLMKFEYLIQPFFIFIKKTICFSSYKKVRSLVQMNVDKRKPGIQCRHKL